MKHFLFFILVLPVAAAAEDLSTLDRVLAAVDADNPELAALRAEARAMAAGARSRAAWPDPEIGYSREKTPTGDRMTHRRVEQTIPFPGKKSLEVAGIRQDARAADARARQRSLALRAEARTLYARLQRGTAVVERWDEQREIVRGLMASLRGRVGLRRDAMGDIAASPMDLFLLEAERGRLGTMIRMERQDRLAAGYRLNRLLGRPPETPWPASAATPLVAPPPAADLLALARRDSPVLAAALARARGAQLQSTRARLSWAPDIGLMWDEQLMDGRRGREAGVSLMVPLWGGVAAESREARGMTAAAAGEQADARNDVVEMVLTEHAEVTARRDAARDYENDILPASRSALALARRQYEAGRLDFPRLMESIRTAVQTEVEHQDALLEYARHWGMLETAVGSPLDDLAHGENR